MSRFPNAVVHELSHMSSYPEASLSEAGQTWEAALSQMVSTQRFMFKKETIDQACTQAQKQRDSVLQMERETEAF